MAIGGNAGTGDARDARDDGKSNRRDRDPGHNRDRTHYQVSEARLCDEIVTLLDYPKVGPLGANAIAINLGTGRERIEPLLPSLVADGEVRQSDDDKGSRRYSRRYSGNEDSRGGRETANQPGRPARSAPPEGSDGRVVG